MPDEVDQENALLIMRGKELNSSMRSMAPESQVFENRPHKLVMMVL